MLHVVPCAPPCWLDGAAWTGYSDGETESLLLDSQAIAGDDVWAVGYAGSILHFDGTAWTAQIAATTGQATLSGVWGSDPTSVFAVGYVDLQDGVTPLLFHYDGTAWGDLSPAP